MESLVNSTNKYIFFFTFIPLNMKTIVLKGLPPISKMIALLERDIDDRCSVCCERDGILGHS